MGSICAAVSYLSFRVDHVLPVVQELELHLVELLLEGLRALVVLHVLRKQDKTNKTNILYTWYTYIDLTPVVF